MMLVHLPCPSKYLKDLEFLFPKEQKETHIIYLQGMRKINKNKSKTSMQ